MRNHRINFICLGIQKGFPTFISMRLRELYHNGDDNVPALYLIEYVSEKALFNKFESMKQYFFTSGLVTMDPPVIVYPWDESVVDSAYEGSWVIAKSDEITIDEQKPPLKIGKLDLTVEDVVDIFRGWVQKLQMMALTHSEEVKNFAGIAVHEMTNVIEELNKRYGVDVRSITEDLSISATTFGMRSKLNYIWRYGSKIDWFFSEVNNLHRGIVVKNESSFEAAKRINIGTITGKHQQKALALKHVTLNEFEAMKREFVLALRTVKPAAHAALKEEPVSS